MDKLKGAKYFTKLDVLKGYNNIRTFQAMMDNIFRDLIDQGCVAVYLDDIIVYTKELDEHRRIVREVLRRLEENDLFLKPEKCEFEKGEVEYLGLLIKQGEIHMDPVKIAGIAEWPVPAKKQQLQSFLGFTNFY